MKHSKHWRAPLCALLVTALLAGCSAPAPSASQSGNASSSPQVQEPNQTSEPEEVVEPDPQEDLPSTQAYIQQIVQEHVARIEQPGMTEFEKVKAAADYLMGYAYYRRPVALDVWRWRTAGDSIPTYEQMRGLHMLLFGFETCEGYTAALNLLLEEMGVETRYMTGMTYLAQGGLGYHSWSQVKVDGVWYHLDCDLEDDIAEDGTVRYRYFLKGDNTMSASHFWGQRLIDLGTLEPGQVEEVQAHYMGEDCPQDYPTPDPIQISVNPEPDAQALIEQLTAELENYEETYGPLEYMELEILPPVFVRYYYEDGQPREDVNERIRTYRETRLIIDPPGTEEASSIPEL